MNSPLAAEGTGAPAGIGPSTRWPEAGRWPDWRFPFPGEAGQRNNFRGQGYFGVDMALRKTWSITERQRLSFSAEAFNITNSVRFDAANTFPVIDSASSFGTYANTLTRPRVMEFALRYSF